MCVDHTIGITTIPKNGMLGVTEVSYHFWYDIHTSFFTVHTTYDVKAHFSSFKMVQFVLQGSKKWQSYGGLNITDSAETAKG